MRSFPVYVDLLEFVVVCCERGDVYLLLGPATLPLREDAIGALDHQVAALADTAPDYFTLTLGCDRSPLGMMLKVRSEDVPHLRQALVDAFAASARIRAEAAHA